jgi:CubicO group peptidase (beta-lactamase class C family)
MARSRGDPPQRLLPGAMNTSRNALIFSALLGLATTVAAQSTPEPVPPPPANAAARSLTPNEIAALEATARAELKSWRAPGMVLAVVRDDAVIYLAAYGTANVETGEPMTPDMMVSVASVTKTITAATALALAANGKLDLDAPIRTYLPWLPERLGALTMGQLLSHTAGLGDRTPPVAPDPTTGALTPIARAMTDDAILAPPGTVWAYSNQDYTLAGCVIEAAGGAPYAQVVKRTLFTPLRMDHSTFNPRTAMTYRHAQGHDTRGDKPAVVRPFGSAPWLAPAGELITTVGDLARFARALMSDGMLDGRRAFPPGLLERMTNPRVKGIAPFGSGSASLNYGLGLFLRQHRDLGIAEHGGVCDGFGAYLCLVPQRRLAAIAVINGRFSTPLRTTQAALEVAAGLQPTWTDPSPTPLPAAAATNALGRYTNAVHTFEIVVNDRVPSLRDGKQVYPIMRRSDGVWEIPGYRPLLPLPAAPLELLETGSGKPPTCLRFGWRLYRRLE